MNFKINNLRILTAATFLLIPIIEWFHYNLQCLTGAWSNC